MPVTIGQPVGRLHEVTTGIDVGQSRARLHPGVDDRHQLALTPENCQAAGRFSIVWLGVGTPGSVPGITPETLHAPRCSIGATGPGSPLGGCAAASTTGGPIAHAGGVHHPATTTVAARHANAARIIC